MRAQGTTRVPPKKNYKELESSQVEDDDKTQEGDDKVFKIHPNVEESALDKGQEGDDESEKDQETPAVPKPRRKTQELVKMFDEMIERRPISQSNYRTKALENLAVITLCEGNVENSVTGLTDMKTLLILFILGSRCTGEHNSGEGNQQPKGQVTKCGVISTNADVTLRKLDNAAAKLTPNFWLLDLQKQYIQLKSVL
ncbi:hypothetical protein KQX54_017751 [Cotesia glomerata]|uniref:Uncharacterized protein n=1 Tax=Cotesia glomerata TaxID=32391 RepID=A0AAV7J524_COTGL|nr:hypothetical protein KQX54_017751 [Cotesia glomerata]